MFEGFRKRLQLVVFVLSLCSASAGAKGLACIEESDLVAGKDASGFFVRVDSASLRQRYASAATSVPKGASLRRAALTLAQHAHSGVVFVTSFSRQTIERDVHIQAADPFEALVALAAKAGLRARRVSDEWWVVEPADEPENRVRVTAYWLDEGEDRAGDGNRLLKAVVRQLDCLDGVNLTVGLHRLPDNDGAGAFLAVVEAREGDGGPPIDQVITSVVRQKTGSEPEVQCAWRVPGNGGGLLLGLNEDFDGDGVQDVVVGSAGGTTSILAGKSGRVLAQFSTDYIAVPSGRAAGGRIVVDAENGQKGGGVVLRFDEGVGKFARDETTRNADGEGPAMRRLAAAAGGLQQVRLYVLPGIRRPHASMEGVETIHLPGTSGRARYALCGPSSTSEGDAPRDSPGAKSKKQQ